MRFFSFYKKMSDVNQFVSAYGPSLVIETNRAIVSGDKANEKKEASSPVKKDETIGDKHEIRHLFVTNVTNEAFQGFFKVLFAPKKTIKIFWILSLIVSNALNAYLVVQSILSYLTFEVSTSSKFLAENPTLFPKITICKLVRFFGFTLMIIGHLNMPSSL